MKKNIIIAAFFGVFVCQGVNAFPPSEPVPQKIQESSGEGVMNQGNFEQPKLTRHPVGYHEKWSKGEAMHQGNLDFETVLQEIQESSGVEGGMHQGNFEQPKLTRHPVGYHEKWSKGEAMHQGGAPQYSINVDFKSRPFVSKSKKRNAGEAGMTSSHLETSPKRQRTD